MYLKHYMLEKKDIEEILKKGKFDEKEYTGKLLCVGWITEDVLDRYLCSNELELEEKEIIAIQEDIRDFNVCDYTENNISDDLSEQIEEYMEEYLKNRKYKNFESWNFSF